MAVSPSASKRPLTVSGGQASPTPPEGGNPWRRNIRIGLAAAFAKLSTLGTTTLRDSRNLAARGVAALSNLDLRSRNSSFAKLPLSLQKWFEADPATPAETRAALLVDIRTLRNKVGPEKFQEAVQIYAEGRAERTKKKMDLVYLEMHADVAMATVDSTDLATLTAIADSTLQGRSREFNPQKMFEKNIADMQGNKQIDRDFLNDFGRASYSLQTGENERTLLGGGISQDDAATALKMMEDVVGGREPMHQIKTFAQQGIWAPVSTLETTLASPYKVDGKPGALTSYPKPTNHYEIHTESNGCLVVDCTQKFRGQVNFQPAGTLRPEPLPAGTTIDCKLQIRISPDGTARYAGLPQMLLRRPD